MGTVLKIVDGLRNAITGQGTNRDARSASTYAVSRPLTQVEIHAAYTASGLIRKIVRIPALDMVREGREWEMEREDIDKIEDEEKRLGIAKKLLQAEVLRGLGGGALILGLPGDPAQPAPNKIGLGGVTYIHVVSRWHLTFDTLQDDARLPGYGEPIMWRMQSGSAQVSVHPSRVIPFRADTTATLAAPSTYGQADTYWGESTVQQVLDAVKDSDTARGAFASLLHKARLTRIGIPNLTDIVATEGGEKALASRLQTMALAESMYNAAIFDSGNGGDNPGEKIEDVQYNFAGAKDVINAYHEFVSAISDIPSTRLLGRAPEGMNSSGDSQQKDWAKKVRSMQNLDLAPCLHHLDAYLVQSALGSMPEKVDWDFALIEAPDEDKEAARFKAVADALNVIANLNCMPDRAFNEAAQNTLVEGEWMPGLGQVLAGIPDEERFGVAVDPGEIDPAEGDPNEPEPTVPPAPKPAARQTAQDRWLQDATPRPLYVQRKLINADELIAWAKEQGFATTLPADELHVTVLYSRQPVDPIKMGNSWMGDEDGNLRIKPGGPRAVERLGENAVVLLFASWELSSRHAEMVAAGGSHDYDEYHPHVTISFDVPADVDLAQIQPFKGALLFGPEEFSALDLNWKSKLAEVA